MKKFKISVIIPIYNVGNYLEETIMSVVKQSIGFKNIQLILVNDGSTDNSEDVCLKFKNMYPNSNVEPNDFLNSKSLLLTNDW